MEKLKVLFITDWYPSQSEPVAGVFVQEHAQAVKPYADVMVLHCVGGRNDIKGCWTIEREQDVALTQGITTYRMWHRVSKLSPTLMYVWGTLKAYKYILASGFQPDIIHAHVFTAGVPAVIIGMLNHLPVVITAHSTSFPRKALNRFGVSLARFAFQRAATVLTVSHALQRAIKAYDIQACFAVIPNAIDTKIFYPLSIPKDSKSPAKLLAVGMMHTSHKKGIPVLLRALAALKLKRQDWYLDIIGDGSTRVEYEKLASDLGLASQITFHGVRPRDDVATFMREATVFVLPSLFETFSVVTAEALASGTPVIATRCGGPEEFVRDGIDGFLIPPGDVQALENALYKMLDNVHLFKTSIIAQNACEYFAPEIIGRHIHQIYIQTVHS